MIIKVCGLTDNESSRLVAKIPGVDYVGFIFYEASRRFTESTLSTEKKVVGVFVNASIQNITRQIQNHSLDAVQLHGNESPEYIRKLPKGVEIIKAFGIATEENLKATEPYNGLVNYFLFDTKSDQHGGTGKAFDWEVLQAYKGETAFLLSGGISPDSVEALKKFTHPKLAGYDLNSRFELAPQSKDAVLIAKFLYEIKL